MIPKAPVLLIAQQPQRSSLHVDFGWIFVGNAVYAGGQWLTLVVLAKLTQPELVGQYALGLAIAVPVIMLTNLQLQLALISDIYSRTHFGHYLSLRLLTTGLALLIIFGVTQILGYHWQLGAVVLAVGVAQAIEAVTDIYYGRLQLHSRIAWIARSMIARTLLSALGLAVGVYVTGNLLIGIVGIVLARIIVLLGYDVRERTHGLAVQSEKSMPCGALKLRWDPKVQRQLLRSSFSLGVIGALVSLNANIPRYFVERALGERELGFFSAIGFMFAAGGMAVVSLGQSAFTRLARLYAAGNFAGFRLLLGKLLVCGATLGVCGIIVAKGAGQEILTILFRPEYAERADLLPWVMAVGGIGYMAQFLGYGMTAARYYCSQIVLFILTSLTVSVGSYVLVPRQGLLGAILAMLISAIVQFVGSAVILMTGVRNRTHPCDQKIGIARDSVPVNVL